MLKIGTLLRFSLLGITGLVVLLLAGCGDHDHHVVFTGPGLIGIDDRPTVAITAPQLDIEYTIPGDSGVFIVQILSDQPLDGDIEFDPFSGSYIITQGPSTLLFGFNIDDSQFRAFLDFPLDGSTGEASIPLDASIISATLTVFIDFVDFAATVPVRLDLVEYSIVNGLAPSDFDSFALEGRSFNLFDSDAGSDVFIDVTTMMREVQLLGLNDFQVRFSVGP